MEYSFRIQVLGRLYHLRADSRASCRDWVITLNRVKEARLHQGNVKLVGGASTNPLDLLHTSGTNSPEHQGGTPRVVVVSNRERTRAVDEDEHWDQLIRVDGPDTDPSNPSYISQSRRSAISTAVVARWTKRHSTFQRLGTKLTKWARSLKKYSCGADMERDVNSVYLDRHVHPPGHDDNNMKQQQHPISKQRQRQGQDKGLSGWMDKESSASAVLLAGQPNPVDLVSPSKPIQAKDRSVSVASSDFDARTIS